jgi:tetratricopeptide (TPR) repeat protein
MLKVPVPGRRRRLSGLVAMAALAVVTSVAVYAAQVSPHTYEANADAVAELCRRLDGLPLAIELAAARAKLLSPQAMISHLDSSLHLLVGGGADRPPRLQTMRGAIEWSYNLLEPAEQRLFRRICVFVGGCMLDAICEVCGDCEPGIGDAAVIERLATLLDHSLVLRDELPDGEVRIRLLEVIREYGDERLAASGEAESTRRAHAAYYLAFATRARKQIEGPDRRSAHLAIHRDLDNLRAALRWLERSGDVESTYCLANELARFWIDLGYISEGRRWLERVIEIPGDITADARAAALYWAAGFAHLQGDRRRAGELADRALELARAHGDVLWMAMAFTQQAGAVAPSNLDRAERLATKALEMVRTLGDEIREGIALRQLGMFAHDRGDHETAVAHHTAALAIWRRLSHPWGVPSALRDQASEALAQGNATLAWVLYRESLARWRELGERLHMSECLLGLAQAAKVLDKPDLGVLLLGAEEELSASMGYMPPQQERLALIDTLTTILGPAAFATTRAEGAARSLDSVIDAVLAVPMPQPKG